MWPPLLCPSFCRAVTACWHDLEYNHRAVMTQRWSLGWPAEPPPAAAQQDVALCPCLLFLSYVHLFGCVRVCVNACEGVAYNTDMISEHLPALGWFCISAIGVAISRWRNADCDRILTQWMWACVLCIHMWRHLHEPEEAVYICILHPEGWKMTCLLRLYLR